MIALVLVPHKRFGRYVAVRDGEKMTKPTRQPFFDAARVLLGRGSDPDTELEASHQGSAIAAMRSTIGEAAKWTIHESDRGGLQKRLWKPYEDIHSRQDGASENGLGGDEEYSPAYDPMSAAGAPPVGEQSP